MGNLASNQDKPVYGGAPKHVPVATHATPDPKATTPEPKLKDDDVDAKVDYRFMQVGADTLGFLVCSRRAIELSESNTNFKTAVEKLRQDLRFCVTTFSESKSSSG